MDCIFCKIIAGEIPSFKVYEDAHSLAFMDINPLSEGHILVLPKKHFVNLFDADDESLGRILTAARKIALGMKTALGIDSMNMLQANGKWAVQSVPHFHLHLIPRRENDGVGFDWELVPGDMEAIGKIAKNIADAVS